MFSGKVVHQSADAIEQSKPAASGNAQASASGEVGSTTISTYKARIQLDQQVLVDAQKRSHVLNAAMQVVAEINQGKHSVLEHLLSLVQKAVGGLVGIGKPNYSAERIRSSLLCLEVCLGLKIKGWF